MKLADCLAEDQVFSWEDPETREVFHFAVGRINSDILSGKLKAPVGILPLQAEFATFLRENRGVEEPRLSNIARLVILNKRFLPVLMAAMPDGTHLLIDGTHRYVVLCEGGAEEIPFFNLPESIWREYLIEDMPSIEVRDILDAPSGIQ